MANMFNGVFANTTQKINEKIPRTKKSPSGYLSSKNAESFFISPVTPHEIKVIINSVKSGKAAGPYSIPIFLLKILCEHIAIPLCDIINNSFPSGVFPDMMKLAKIIPLYENDSPEVASNDRPISLLLVFSKIVEKLMHFRIYKFLRNVTFFILFSLASVVNTQRYMFNKYD